MVYICKNYENWMAVDKVTAIIKRCHVYAPQCTWCWTDAMTNNYKLNTQYKTRERVQ